MENTVIRAIQEHRSIRKYSTREVEAEKLEQIIKSAQCAPTTRHMQAYTIIGVKNREHRALVAQTCGKDFIRDCPVFLLFCPDLRRVKYACFLHGKDFQADYTNYLIIAIVDASLAAQNAALAAESLGLGTVYIGGLRNDPAQICEVLELPELVFPMVGMCIGYPDEEVDFKPRLPLELIYREDRYPLENEEDLLGQYDRFMEQYYTARTKGEKHDNWTGKIAAEMESEKRAAMKDFLTKIGFAAR